MEKWKEFYNKLEDSSLLIQVIFEFEDVPFPINPPIILFIKNLYTDEEFNISIKHPDVFHGDIHKTLPIIIDDINSLTNFKWVLNKKAVIQHIDLNNLKDIGLLEYYLNGVVLNKSEYETPAHSFLRARGVNDNKIIPYSKHEEAFTNISTIYKKIINKDEYNDGLDQYDSHILLTLSKIETYGLEVNENLLKEKFPNTSIYNGKVYTDYNLYTSTGRPSNSYGGINYAALNKTDGSRKCFISRYGEGGELILMDYSAFHPHIIALLTKYSLPSGVDIYEYLGKLYFQKDKLDDLDLEDSKKITFRQLYGGVQEKYKHIKYLSNLKEFIDEQWKRFNRDGYVRTPIFGRKISEIQIGKGSPHKVFNYILQAVEGEISIPIMGKIDRMLKNQEAWSVLYTYDSILFDMKRGQDNLIKSIREIMNMDQLFPIKIYRGHNFHEMERIY